MHLLVIRGSEAPYYLLTTVLVIRARGDWKLLPWDILRVHHKMMGVAVHGPSALFGCFYHGRQLNHLTTNNPSIRYGITNLAISTATGVIL
jgi:hypothetical protein